MKSALKLGNIARSVCLPALLLALLLFAGACGGPDNRAGKVVETFMDDLRDLDLDRKSVV